MEMVKREINFTKEIADRFEKVCVFPGDLDAFMNLAAEIFLNENEDRIKAVNDKLME